AAGHPVRLRAAYAFHFLVGAFNLFIRVADNKFHAAVILQCVHSSRPFIMILPDNAHTRHLQSKIFYFPPDFHSLALISPYFHGLAQIFRSAFTASINAACVVSFSNRAFMICSSMVPFVMMCCTTTVSDCSPCRQRRALVCWYSSRY